jgi:hypothetical protein
LFAVNDILGAFNFPVVETTLNPDLIHVLSGFNAFLVSEEAQTGLGNVAQHYFNACNLRLVENLKPTNYTFSRRVR